MGGCLLNVASILLIVQNNASFFKEELVGIWCKMAGREKKGSEAWTCFFDVARYLLEFVEFPLVV